MPKCSRKKGKPEKKEPQEVQEETHSLPLDDAIISSTLLTFLKDATAKLQQPDADPLPVLRGIIQNCPQPLSGDEARNFEEAAIDAVFDLSRVLLDFITLKRGPVTQVASLALFNVIPAVVGVKKSVQFLVSSTSALSNMYTKHWSNGMIHWGKAPNYENMDENTDCYARLQRMHYLMRILNCRKDMLEQQTNALRDQLKKHQMYLAGPSRARSKRRYHKREMVSAEDFHEFKSSLKKEPEDFAECFSKMRLDKGAKSCRHELECHCKGPDDGFKVQFKRVNSPDIMLEIFESIFEDPYAVIRKEFNWNEENLVEQRYWHSIFLQLHLIHGAMESPSSREIYADSYEEWSAFACFFNVIERSLLCPATRYHPLAVKNWHGWLETCIFFVSVPMKTHNIRLADDVLNGIRRSMWILNSSFWDSGIFSKLLDLHNLSKIAFANIKNRIKDPEMLDFDFTEAVLRELPWKNKRKLQILAKLIPHWQDLDIKRIVKKKGGMPSFAASLAESLEFNELRSSCSDVFRACLERLSKEQFVREFVPVIEASLANRNHHMGLVNYWLPALSKKYPDVAKNLQVLDLHAHMVLLNTLRKEGVLTLKDLLTITDEKGGRVIDAGLQADELLTRNRALISLCVGYNFVAQLMEKQQTLETVLYLVKEFLKDNITIASRPSRNIYMGTFLVFFGCLRDFLLQVLKNSPKKDFLLSANQSTAPIMSFFKWLRDFILAGIELGFSYQRTYTSLYLYENVLCAFVPPENSLKAKTEKLIKVMQSEGCFLFLDSEMFEATLKCSLSPDDDVQVMSSYILASQRDFDMSAVSLPGVSKEALLLCSSNKFYVVSGGAQLFATVAKITKTPIEEALNLLLQQALSEFSILKGDLLKGALENGPIYGCLDAVSHIFNLEKKPDVSQECLVNILSLIEEVTDHFLKVMNAKSSTQEFASSFEDMDWSIEAEIDENYSLDSKSLHLTPQFQYALNCAWLNLKTCTELVSQLGYLFCVQNASDEILWRCSMVIMNVLQKCRHKGAFEASGLVLGNFVKNTSILGKDIPKKMLDKLMSTLCMTGSDAPPLSRRSAGLAVAIQKIVASDTDQEKELLHDTIEKLLAPTDDSKGGNETEDGSKVTALVDSVKTRKMHVLYTLVSDASIGQHINCHLENIAQMAIYFLNADDWGVKNAAMQLFGAFVKKIVSQRKSKPLKEDEFNPECIMVLASEQEEADWDMMGNGLLEDVFVRSSYLLTQVLAIIKYPPTLPEEGQTLCTQMVPCCNVPDEGVICAILGFLQHLTPGPPSMWTADQGQLVNDICYYCWQLLEHPNWLVRKQAAECATAMVNKSHVASTLKTILDELDRASPNKLHGFLLMVTKIKKKIAFFREDTKKLEATIKEIDAKITSRLLVDLADGKQQTHCIAYSYATIEGLQKDDLLQMLIYLAEMHDMMAIEKHCHMLFALEMVEQVVSQHQEWLPEILALCSSYSTLVCVQEHLLHLLTKSNFESEAIAEQLEVVLEYNLDINSCKHNLVSILRPLLMWKRRIWSKYLMDSKVEKIWFGTFEKLTYFSNHGCHIKIHRLLSEGAIVGDEFESLALTFLAYSTMELLVSGQRADARKLLTTLVEHLLKTAENRNVPEISMIGPALRVISPATWELFSIVSNYPDMILVGKTVLKLTHMLLLQQNLEAAKSIWPMRSKEHNYCIIGPSTCLRKLYEVALENLLPVSALEEYLWEILAINSDTLISIFQEGITSPFSHVDEVELDFFEHITEGFVCICKATKCKMTGKGVPSPDEMESDEKIVSEALEKIESSFKGKQKQLHLSVIVAKKKLCLKVFILEKFYSRQMTDVILEGKSFKDLSKLFGI
ncbi:uncharacterized protein LOC132203268 [Neocloeon triangulifer]|uniref:uncharacterized protein LOC132203268 n=1 Tax=Neocloeon triangulifer TaxID=2078957 RepID=UPI00286ECDF2|nr:uncharacterized protein LOC132203268 [Neocloeon triangulifer]